MRFQIRSVVTIAFALAGPLVFTALAFAQTSGDRGQVTERYTGTADINRNDSRNISRCPRGVTTTITVYSSGQIETVRQYDTGEQFASRGIVGPDGQFTIERKGTRFSKVDGQIDPTRKMATAKLSFGSSEFLCMYSVSAELQSLSAERTDSDANASPTTSSTGLASVGSCAQCAAFEGKWSGRWDGTLDSTLIVESTKASGEARGVYTWGRSLYVSPGSTNFRGKIDGDMLTWGDGIKGVGFEFKLLPNGSLKGERFNRGSQQGAVTMKK